MDQSRRGRFALIALWGLLALPCGAAPTPTPPPGSVDSSQIRLEAGDAAGALVDAELVISSGGGADAFAARADAKRALGRPYEEVLADYAQAARLDPRLIVKHDGFITLHESEIHPPKKKGGSGLNGVPMRFIVGVAVLGTVCIIIAVVMTRRRRGKPVVPADIEIKPPIGSPRTAQDGRPDAQKREHEGSGDRAEKDS